VGQIKGFLMKSSYEELCEGIVLIQDRVFKSSPSTDDERTRYIHELDQYLTEHEWTLSEYYKAFEESCKDQDKEAEEFLALLKQKIDNHEYPEVREFCDVMKQWIEENSMCDKCKGEGSYPDHIGKSSELEYKICDKCQGTGRKRNSQ
jgi:hypothetical protein